MIMSSAKENSCRKFQANFFNKSKCQNCFKPRELHLLTDQDLTQVRTKMSPSVYLLLLRTHFCLLTFVKTNNLSIPIVTSGPRCNHLFELIKVKVKNCHNIILLKYVFQSRKNTFSLLKRHTFTS